MGGGSEHSMRSKEDFRAKIKSNIFIYAPIAGMLICVLTAFVAIFGNMAYCTWTGDFSSLGSFAYFLGKLLAIAIVLFAWLIAVLGVKCTRAMWRKM